MKNSTPVSANMAQLQARAKELRLAGLLAHWDTLVCDPVRLGWVTELLGWEETERDQRSLERRLRSSHIGKFKPLADFEWDWPKRCDRQAIQELMTLSFMADASNVMLVGPNGVGKSMLACNLGHQALIQGHTVLFITAGQLLGELAALDSDSALRRRLKHYAAPDLLLIDEVGVLVVFQPARRFTVRADQSALRAQEHRHHHQSRVQGMARGVSQCRLCSVVD